jgi:hypothetical protein
MGYSDNPVRDAIAHHERIEVSDAMREAAHPHAVAAVCGTDADLTAETFSEFVVLACDDAERKPMLSKPAGWVLGPISSPELVSLLLTNHSDAMLAAAVRELRARYLAADHTKAAIDNEVDRLMNGMLPV